MMLINQKIKIARDIQKHKCILNSNGYHFQMDGWPSCAARLYARPEIIILSVDAYNHVDVYSGTLGGVRNVRISTLVTSP